MNRRVLLEQCYRLKSITEDENALYISPSDEWWLNHNKGHKEVINKFITSLYSKDFMHKKDASKWLKSQIRNSDKIINVLDKKYSNFENGEEMSREDDYSYSFNDGIKCEAITIIEIVNGKLYISKDAYIKTDRGKVE